MASSLSGRWTQKRQELERQGLSPGICQQCMQSKARFMLPSVKEVAEVTLDKVLHHDRKHSSNQEQEDRLARARECTDAGVKAGLRAGSYTLFASAIPTLAAVRFLPWAKNNINYTGQALIISSVTVAAYFVTTEQTIMACSRDASYARLAKEREEKEAQLSHKKMDD